MIYLCVQPDIGYFHWQIEVMLSSFEQVGVDLKKCYIILLYEEEQSQWSVKIKEKYSQINILSYKDDREDKSYPPSVKPYGFFKFLYNNKEFENQPIFYHDSDIILTDLLDKEKLKGEGWLLSDTVGYIGHLYIKSKGEKQADEIYNFFGIDKKVVESNQENSGGAQYVIRGTNEFFWKKVYEDSNSLYKYLSEKESEYKGEDYPIQKWCAEMWSTLWNAWLCNIPTKISKELDFCFATDRVEELKNKKILHNAGVTVGDKERMFFKGDYINKSPFKESFENLDKTMCSYRYAEQIKRIK